MMATSTVVGGYMVEAAQATSGSGRLTSVRNSVDQFGLLVSGPAGGFLASIAFGWTAISCGGILFLIVPAAVWLLHEQRRRIAARELFDQAGKQLVKIANARTMWAAAGLMALFYCAPGLFTAVFYKQQNDLHLSTQGQGYLQFLSGAFGVWPPHYTACSRRAVLHCARCCCGASVSAPPATWCIYFILP